MDKDKTMRLSQLARTLNVGTNSIVDFLGNKGFDIDNKPNTKISGDQVEMLNREFSDSAQDKSEAKELTIGTKLNKNIVIEPKDVKVDKDSEEELKIKNFGSSNTLKTPDPKPEALIPSIKLEGIKVIGKIDLDPKSHKKPEVKQEVKAEPKPEVKAEIKPEIKAEIPVSKPEEKLVQKPEVKVEEIKVEKTPESIIEAKEIKPIEKPIAKIEIPTKKPFEQAPIKKEEPKQAAPVVNNPVVTPVKEATPPTPPEDKVIRAKSDELRGLKVLGKIELPVEKPKSSGPGFDRDKKGKRKRIRIDNKPVDVKKAGTPGAPGLGNRPASNPGYQGKKGNFQKPGTATPVKKDGEKEEISQKDIQDKIKATMARLSGGYNNNKGVNRSKYKKEKRSHHADQREEARLAEEQESKVLKCTEFVSANDLAALMDVTVNQVISKCMMLGMIISINQRLDAEAITIIADEFDYEVSFTSTEEEADSSALDIVDSEEDLLERAPIVTIMGHVDHGKTSLLDYIRKSKVASGEAGGITQHIGAYSVKTDLGKRITFLDTPGHEAFTAMRARGAKLTDIVILVVAADDRVMPQTKEAINHAQIAGVPIIIALNKVDKQTADPEKIKKELANENILVEDWGGKYQCQEVSAKSGQGIDELLEKILLESEVLELKANPNRNSIGTVVEASLDKGRGYVTNILVQTGTLKIGDIVVAGANHGRVKAMLDSKGRRVDAAGPSIPIQLLGLDGAPQAGDRFTVVETEKEAKDICNRRSQLMREQSVRTKKHITLDEIGRRLAIGTFKELNVIIKGDVDGSVEALTDSLLKLSTEEVQVNVIHKAVGQITESDVLLASASEAIIIGFQVRPSQAAKKLAENEEIEIRHYSIIYKAIDEMKDALEGLLEPDSVEVITGNIEVREVFKISKIGTVAGCLVLDGYVKRANGIRLIREGVVKYEGEIGALKRFKDDVMEVKNGYECGLSIKNYHDIEVGDVVESFEIRETKRKLK
jgi:translation initiation factor IF-2